MERKTPVGMTAPTAGGSTPMIDDFIIRQISRAELLVGSDQIEEAISTLNEILKLNPDSTHAHMKLKDVYLRAGMKQQAAEECLQLARIYESQGERASANDYLVRARFLSPTTGTLPAKVRPIQPVANGNQPVANGNQPVNGKAPSATNGASAAKRPPQPDSKTGPDSVRAAGGIQQPAQPVRSIPESHARQVPDVISVPPKSPAPVQPANSVAAPRTPGSEITVPELSIDAGTRFLKTDLADIRRAVLGEDLSAEAASDMQPLPLYEVDPEPESVDPRTLHASTLAAPQAHVQVMAAPSLNVVTSPLVKSGGKGRWLYRTAIAVVLLAGTAVGGGFWFNSRLDRQFAALNREYEEAAYASSLALAQADIVVEDVNPESVVVDSQTEEVQPTTDDTQRNKPEQDLADRKMQERQQAQAAAARAAELQLASVAPPKTETRKASPLPPLTSQVSVTGTQPVADNRTASLLMNAGPTLGPPEPPPPAPAPARKVVVSAEAISKVQPSYPRTAVTARVSGAVAVLVTVNEQGNVVEARAISGPSLLWGAAVDAARRWKFKPSTIGGVAAKTSKTIVFNFKSDR